ncbi:MAG: O-methyltransferase [Vicinamibacterales bacterium]
MPAFTANVTALAAAQPVEPAWWTPAPPACAATVAMHGPRLRVSWPGGTPVSFGGPGEASRWLASAFGTGLPLALAVAGAGTGDILEAIWAQRNDTAVVVVEPEPALLRTLLEAQDWTTHVRDGRLRVIGGSADEGAKRLWEHLAVHQVPPLLVRPVLARQAAAHAARARALYARARVGSDTDPRAPQVRRSMLHQEVLLLLEQAASTVRGGIVEIGAYVGGSTVAMARGLRSTGHRAPFVSIEPGGVYLEHPDLPSADIFGDLRRFVEEEALTDWVELAQGYSTDAAIQARVAARLDGQPLGLLFLDADGEVLRDFRDYLPLCREGALIVVDDYSSPHVLPKVVPTRRGVDLLVGAGVFLGHGVHGWGTWFGTLTRRITADDLDSLTARAA